MRKLLIAAAAFLASALVGVVLLLAVIDVWALLELRRASGIGAIAGRVSEAAVTLVAIFCGVLGTVVALNRLNRPRT